MTVADRVSSVGARLMRAAASMPRRLARAPRSEERIRLMIFLNNLAPYGAETFVLNHVTHADHRRFDISVCHLGGVDTLAPRLREAGARVFSVHEEHRFSPRAMGRLARLIVSERIDILQTHIAYAGIVGRLVGTTAGVPVIVSTEQAMRDNYVGWLRTANDMTFPLCDANVFISQAVVRSFADVFPRLLDRPQHVVSNGIDAQRVAAQAEASRAALRAELGLGAGDFVFGNVGRLVPIKGQAVAIRALARVRARLPGARLWLIGAGPCDAELRKTARDEGVADAVTFLGERMDVHRLLGALDAYVHPSTTEALGIAVLEAMAAGLPTIASAVGGIPEFVLHDRTGWLIQPTDVDGLTDLMLRVALDRDRAREVAARGREIVLREHDIRASVAAYERIYRAAYDQRLRGNVEAGRERS